MQRLSYLILFSVFFLAACGGNATSTPDLPTAAVLPTSADQAVQATAQPQSDVPTFTPALATQTERTFGADATLPPSGVLVAAATEDPSAGQVFDTILFTREGGLAGGTLTVEIKGDGTLTNNGVTKQLSAAQVSELTNLIDKMNFFGVQGIFASPGTSADIYHYSLTIDRAGNSKTIDAQDGLAPQELMEMFTKITELAE